MFSGGPRRSPQRNDDNRMSMDMNRGRNSPYRDRYPTDRRHPDDGYSPRREGYSQRNDGFRNRGNDDWRNNRSSESYGRRRSPGRSPRYYSDHRRDSNDHSPKIGRNFNRSRSRSRSYSRGRRRSGGRSSSRGRGRYRRSSSSDRGHRSRRRSSSYDSRKRLRSSSSDSSSSSGRSRNQRSTSRERPWEHFVRSIYTEQDDQSSNYLHPVLDKGPKVKVQRAPLETRNAENTTAQNLSNTESLSALSKNYDNSPKKFNEPQEMDDEDRFLYGDDGQQNSSREAQTQEEEDGLQQDAPPNASVPTQLPLPSQDAQNVTPGGFDSNALKNVLKAIGFDFEMSEKQSQVLNLKAKANVYPVTTAATTQPVAIVNSAPNPPVNAPPGNPQVKQQLYQPYNPYTEAKAQQPIKVQDNGTNSSGYLVYQPINAQGQVQGQTLFTAHDTAPNLTLIQPGTTVIAKEPISHGGRVVLPPGNSVLNVERAVTDEQVKKNKLDYLQEELDLLKKQQNSLLRKKQREKDGHKDPMITKNTLLQAGVEEQIRQIQADGNPAWMKKQNLDDALDKEDKYDYFDPGNHWCKLCNTVSHDLPDFLTHLHSKIHRKAIDPYNRPWNDLEPKKKKKAKDCTSKALKGSEFLIPITGYFCTICQTFSGDQICAEDHLKTYAHNAQYKKFCKQNKAYEKHQKKKKKEAQLLDVANEKREEEKERLEVEAKYIEKDSKKKKNKTSKRTSEEKYREEEYRRKDGGENRDDRERDAMPRKYRELSNEHRRTESEARKSGSRWSPGYDEYEKNHQEHRYRTPEKKRRTERRSRSRSRERWIERSIAPDHRKEQESQPRGNKTVAPTFGKFSWNSGSKMNALSSRLDLGPLDTQLQSQKEENVEDRKGKIAIKITGKVNQPKLITPTPLTKLKNPLDSAGKTLQGKRAAMENELRRKVEALKRENALKAQLSSITLPSGRPAKQYQSSPNTAAIILGTRNVGRVKLAPKPQNPVATPPPLPETKQPKPPLPEPPKQGMEGGIQPFKKEAREPPPPGEEDITMGDEDEGATSDASGISMELASDED